MLCCFSRNQEGTDPGSKKTVKVLRVLRVLRPLKAINKAKKLKVRSYGNLLNYQCLGNNYVPNVYLKNMSLFVEAKSRVHYRYLSVTRLLPVYGFAGLTRYNPLGL